MYDHNNFNEIIRGNPRNDTADRCLALALLTDHPEKDDNGVYDVVQEPTERIHADRTAVILANSPRPDTPRFLREIIGGSGCSYRRAISASARTYNVQEFRGESLLGLLCVPSFLPSFLPSDSLLSSLPVSLPLRDIDSTTVSLKLSRFRNPVLLLLRSERLATRTRSCRSD